MKKILSLLVLSSAVCGSAMATCPQIEGKYVYTCTVTKDKDADFADVLDVSGKIIVNQTRCESYIFTNPSSQIQEDFRLVDIDDLGYRSQSKIKKSTANLIKFTVIDRGVLAVPGGSIPSFKSEITKGTIRKKKNGFALKGKERSRVLGIFGKKHSKFNCRFTEER